jgi:hypothetical protein
MQYFVNRRDDGQLIGHIVVVTDINAPRSALTHVLGPALEQRYVFTPESESGPTQLEVTFSWPGRQTGAADEARSRMAQAAQKLVSGYKAVIETAA